MNVRKILMMPIGSARANAIRSLHDKLHYEIPFSSIQEIVCAVETVQKRGNHIKVIILDGIQNAVDEDFRCKYGLSPKLLNLMEEIKWEHLNSKLLQNAPRDSRRNVSSQDI
jgi:hypothetical protein